MLLFAPIRNDDRVNGSPRLQLLALLQYFECHVLEGMPWFSARRKDV